MSAEGRPRSPLFERRALALAFACTACFGFDLGYDERQDRTAARYIEVFCKHGRYELEGSARRTSGLTNDSCGFSVGPQDGVVRFIVPSRETAFYVHYWFNALVTTNDGEDATWVELTEEDRDATSVAFSVTPLNGKRTRVIDVVLIGQGPEDVSPGCSIAGRRRRAQPSAFAASSAERTAASMPEP